MKKTVADYPHLVKEWHEKNQKKPENYKHKSRKKVWWKCSKLDCNYEWINRIDNRTYSENGCPACANQVVSPTNSLLYKYPEIAKELHTNNKITADKIIAGTHKKYKWKCKKCKYEWEATCNNRTSIRSGCPICNDTTNMRPKWNGWEKKCEKIGENIYGSSFKIKPRLPNGKIPDFQSTTENLIIDAKTHCWIPEIEEDIQNYLPFCDRLEFWCLEGKREIIIQDGKEIVFINADILLPRITNESFKQECKEEIERLRKWKYEEKNSSKNLNDYLQK